MNGSHTASGGWEGPGAGLTAACDGPGTGLKTACDGPGTGLKTACDGPGTALLLTSLPHTHNKHV